MPNDAALQYSMPATYILVDVQPQMKDSDYNDTFKSEKSLMPLLSYLSLDLQIQFVNSLQLVLNILSTN